MFVVRVAALTTCKRATCKISPATGSSQHVTNGGLLLQGSCRPLRTAPVRAIHGFRGRCIPPMAPRVPVFLDSMRTPHTGHMLRARCGGRSLVLSTNPNAAPNPAEPPKEPRSAPQPKIPFITQRAEPLGSSLLLVPKPALVLGFAGLIPFAGTGFVVCLPYLQGDVVTMALDAQIYYAVTILTFVGAVQWGLAIAGFRTPTAAPNLVAGPTWGRLLYSVTPSLLGWLALLVRADNTPLSLSLLIGGFAGALLYDLSSVSKGLAPWWYRHIRIPLSATVIMFLLASMYVTTHDIKRPS